MKQYGSGWKKITHVCQWPVSWLCAKKEKESEAAVGELGQGRLVKPVGPRPLS